MSFFTYSGNKLAATVLAAGVLVVGGTGVAAIADSLPDAPSVTAESPSPTPTATETEAPEPSPTATETESPEPSPTATETESPEPTPTETETASPSPSPTETEEPDPEPTSDGGGPDATGPAAYGLCNAFSNGGLNETSTAFAALAEAAGGESGIESYCATVAAPEDDADETVDAPEEQEPAEQQVQEQQVQDQRQGAGQGQGANNGSKSDNAGGNSGGQGGRGQR